jgi:hypothetical protein
LPLVRKLFTNATATLLTRKVSGLATSPGTTSASNRSGFTLFSVVSTLT